MKKTRYWMIGLSVVLALLLALPVALAQNDDRTASEIEFTGVIAGLDAENMLLFISGLTVDYSEAEIDTALEIGAVVEVEGSVLESGIIAAREIDDPDDDDRTDDPDDADDDELELVGTLDSLDAVTAVVNGISFDITRTEVKSGLVVGDLVEVEARYDVESGTWIARELEFYDPDDDDDRDDDD